jgi:hypothetical protein
MPLHVRLHWIDAHGINHDLGTWPLRDAEERRTVLDFIGHLLDTGRVPRVRIAWQGQRDEEACSPLSLIEGLLEGCRMS